MAPPKDIARSYPKRGLTADVGFRSEPKFCGDGSVSLDGSTQGAHVATTYDIAAAGAKTTIAAWVNYDTATVSSARMIAGNTVLGGGRLALYQTATNTLMAGLTYGGGALAFGTPSILSSNRWYFCAATFDNDTATFKFYLDGIEFNTVPTFGGGSTVDQFEIGARYNGGIPLLHFGGKLAHVMMIEDVLTQGEIVELMRDTSYAKAQTFGTVNRYYELDADFNDDTGSHNATSYGSPSFTVDRPQLPRGLDLARGAAQARVYTGRAVDFDGSADRITAAHYNPSGDYLTTTGWVNADTLRGQGLIHNGDTGRNSFLFYMNGATGDLDFYWNDTTGDARIRHQTQLAAGQWYHLAAVMDMSDAADHQVTWYINGIAATGTRASSSWVGDGTYQIGNQYASAGWFDGKIADCRIYDVALTQAQVRELYHNPEQVLPTGVSASNLRRYYPLSDYNDTAGTGGRYFQDMGADGEPAEDKGSALMAFAQPVPCPQLGLQQSATRLHFPGTTVTGSAIIPALGTAASLSCWFFWDNSSRTSYPIAVGTVNSAVDGLNIRIDTSGNVTTYENAAFDSGLNVTEGTWNHIVIVSQTASPYWKCFVNNTEATSPAAKSAAINITSTNAYVGTNNNNFGAAGIVADAAIWSSELSDANVAALYNSGVMGADVSQVDSSNLVAWWKCDGIDSFKDYSGNGRTMSYSTALTAASFPENASGSTIVGDFSMKRKGVSILNLTGPDDGTAIISAQEAVYPKAGAANGYTIGFCYRKIKDGTAMVWGNDGASLNNQFMCFQQTGPNLRFNLGDGSSRPSVNTSNITDSDWHHYTLTISYATTPAEVKIYVDGAVDHSSTQSITGPPTDIREMRLGEGLFDSQSPVGCFKFYQVALSSDEVKRLAFSDLRLIKGLNNE